MILIRLYNIPFKVCDDYFEDIDARSACHTLGYTGGSFKTITQLNWALNEIPFLMDDVGCTSSEGNFLECSRADTHNCQHSENVLLTCGPKRELLGPWTEWSTCDGCCGLYQGYRSRSCSGRGCSTCHEGYGSHMRLRGDTCVVRLMLETYPDCKYIGLRLKRVKYRNFIENIG